MELAHHSAGQCLRDPWGSYNSDKLLAWHDWGFLNYPSCTMKYVVKATCRIKRHSKTKASQILWAFNPSVSMESRAAKPTDSKSLWLLTHCHTMYFSIFPFIIMVVQEGDNATIINMLEVSVLGSGAYYCVLKSWATWEWLSLCSSHHFAGLGCVVTLIIR